MTTRRIPDAFRFADGSPVETLEDWKRRREELKTLYQSCMYGMWRDGEAVDYEELTEVVTGKFTATDWKDFSTWRYVETREPATDVKKSLKLTVSRTTFAARKEAPVVSEDVLAARRESPVVSEDTLAAGKEAPVVSEDMLAARKEAPVVSEDAHTATGEEQSELIPGRQDEKTNIKESSFCVNLFLPEDENQTHKNGAPIFIEIGSLGEPVREYLLSQGYAVFELPTAQVASDDDKRGGAFYEIYPYGKQTNEQTGVLMAWAWGVSKLIDVLSLPGVAEKFGLNPKLIIVNGVSRNGKAAAVAGAFDERITVTAPSSSGAGGLVLFGCQSEGLRFDYSPLKREEFIDFQGESEGNASYEQYQSETERYVTVTTNQSFSHLGVDAMGGWVIDAYRAFSSLSDFPLDQHLLGALTAGEGRFLYITSEVVGGDWVNTPGTYACYLEMQRIFKRLGLLNHLAAHLHAVGHAFTRMDAEYLVAFCEEKIFGTKDVLTKQKLSRLSDCVYEQGQNQAVFYSVYDDICSV